MNQIATSPTLDTLFGRILARKPRELALRDPGNKLRVTGQTPKRLTYEEADRAISALAAHFIESGLPAHSVIAVQLPNTVELALTVLAAHRAGLVVALFPLLWRQAELVAALNRTSARAIVTSARVDGVAHSDLAMNAAAEAFSIRHVCGFGGDLPEGMASLDQALAQPSSATRHVIQDGRKAAIISFDVTSDGFRAVPRTHLSLIAGGLALSLESNVPQGATLMSAFAPTSFAGLASSVVAWLLSGGTLSMHHPFEPDVLEQDIREHGCDTLIVPAPLAFRLGELDIDARLPSLRNVIGMWRAPEQVTSSPPWIAQRASLTDAYLFGEAGLFGARRTARGGTPALVKPGLHGAPRELPGSSISGEILLTPKGTLGLRGPMVAIAAYAPPAPRQRLPDPAGAARLRRHRICGAARPHDRRDRHYCAAVRHHGRRRLSFPGTGPAGMGQAARPGRASHRASGSPQRPPAGGPRHRQRPRPRRALRTWPQPLDGGSLSGSLERRLSLGTKPC